MNIYNSRSYWLLQLVWWLFATGYLRRPYSDFFSDSTNLYPYLIGSFAIGFLFSHFYAWLFPKFSHIKGAGWYFSLFGIFLMGVLFFTEDALYGFMRYTKPSLGLPLNIEDYLRFFTEPLKIVILWFLFYHLLYVNLKNQVEIVALAEANAALKTAELENLKNQLNPHFLFNSLNSIKALTNDEPQRAKMAITMLSDLLRASLTYGNSQTISLQEEISLVKQYLTLEKIRFDKRLSYEINVGERCLEHQIPPMTLQLLVENAIKHGISKRKDGGKILIDISNNEDACTCQIINTGTLNAANRGLGIGQQNLVKRLLLTFGDRANFQVTQQRENVVATITIKNKTQP